MSFQLSPNYQTARRQEQAIAKLLKFREGGNRHQEADGVTGSRQDFHYGQRNPAMTDLRSSVRTINAGAQLYSDFKQLFPRNAVEYFVQLFELFTAGGYIPLRDTYI